MPKICEKLKPFMTRAWQRWCPGTEARAPHRQLVPRGLKKLDQPVRRELGLELAFPGEDAGTSSLGRPMAPSPRQLPIRPGRARLTAPRERPRGMFGFNPLLVSSLGEESCRELHPPPAPRPITGALCFCSLAGDLAKWRSARAEGEVAKSAQSSPHSKPGTGGPAAGVEAPQKQRQSPALQQVFRNIKVMLDAVLPEEHNAQGQEQLCMCPALVFRKQAFPRGWSCPKLGMEDGERRCVGRVVAQTLTNVMLSYFKIFFLSCCPLTKMCFGVELIMCSLAHGGLVRG